MSLVQTITYCQGQLLNLQSTVQNQNAGGSLFKWHEKLSRRRRLKSTNFFISSVVSKHAIGLKIPNYFFIILILFKRQRSKDQKRSSPCWFTPQMPIVSRAGPNAKSSGKLSLSLPHVKQRPKNLSSHLLIPKSHISRQLDCKWHSNTEL